MPKSLCNYRSYLYSDAPTRLLHRRPRFYTQKPSHDRFLNMCFDVDIRAEVTSLVPTEIVGASEHNTHMRTLRGQKSHRTVHSHIIQSSIHDQAAPSQEAGMSYNAHSKKSFLDTERHLHEAFSPTMAHAPVKLMRHLRHFAFQMNIFHARWIRRL